MKHNLTKEQAAIIHTKKKRVYIPAVAGSGKTHTLSERVKNLLASGVSTEAILALSFSNQAVDVLRERIGSGITAMTFHAFGKSLVKQRHGRSVKVATPTENAKFLKRAIAKEKKICSGLKRSAGIDLKDKAEQRRLLDFLSAAQGDASVECRLVAGGAPAYSSYAPILEELREIHKCYRKLMKGAKRIDYAEMLRRGSVAMPKLDLPYTHLFVDECQDMNQAQMRLLATAVEKIPNVMMFGDPRQSIFGFMGAQFHNMSDVMDRFHTMPLTKSFRLSHQTAALADAILKGETSIEGARNGDRPTLTSCKTTVKQEDAIVALVCELMASGVSADEIAILGRTKAQLRAIEQALISTGQATQPRYEKRLSDHTQQMLDLLKSLNRNYESFRDLEKANKKLRKQIEKKLAAFVDVEVPGKVLADCRRRFVEAARAPTFAGRYVAIKKIYVRLMKAAGENVKPIRIELGRWEAISSKFNSVKKLRAFIEHLAAQTPVTLSTIHGAKGDEWNHVIVAGVTDGSIPFYREMERGDLDEERRLLYVAVTRARKRLHLFHAPFHHAPSGRRFDEPSRFVTSVVKKLIVKRPR